MASSNRHWPSMFKSKPCNSSHHQWQHDINSSLISTGCLRTPYTTAPGCEERTPEPKPRWNPRPEQIRILESIFNSGMVNPPRDEIRKIRAQLQEYGQVGDANVFYWFQNRKSRSKHKQRQLQNNNNNKACQQTPPITNAPTSNSSSSSSNNSAEKVLSVGSSTVIDLLNSPTTSVNKPFFQTPSEFLTEPFYYPVQQNGQGFCFPDVVSSAVVDQSGVGECPSFLLNELMLMSSSKKAEDEKMKLQLQQQEMSYNAHVTSASNTNATHSTVAPSMPVPASLPSTNYIFQGVPESGPTKSTVFINDVCFEVGIGPFNVKEAFGDDAVLIQSNGQHVVTNEWGVTLQPLQHGSFYYLMRAFAPSHDDRTIDLM